MVFKSSKPPSAPAASVPVSDVGVFTLQPLPEIRPPVESILHDVFKIAAGQKLPPEITFFGQEHCGDETLSNHKAPFQLVEGTLVRVTLWCSSSELLRALATARLKIFRGSVRTAAALPGQKPQSEFVHDGEPPLDIGPLFTWDFQQPQSRYQLSGGGHMHGKLSSVLPTLQIPDAMKPLSGEPKGLVSSIAADIHLAFTFYS